jgi:hypothetical protein
MTDSVDQQAEQNGTDTDGPPPPPLLRSASSGLKRNRGCFLIGIAGGTASGKTTVCHRIMDRLQDQCARLIHQDSYYRGLTPEEHINVRRECRGCACSPASQSRITVLLHKLSVKHEQSVIRFKQQMVSGMLLCSYQQPQFLCLAAAAAATGDHACKQSAVTQLVPALLHHKHLQLSNTSLQALRMPKLACTQPLDCSCHGLPCLNRPSLLSHRAVLCCAVRCCPADYNFDHPDAFDHNGLLQCLKDLKVCVCGGGPYRHCVMA